MTEHERLPSIASLIAQGVRRRAATGEVVMLTLSDGDIQALAYIENTGHTATVDGFDEDHEPIGPMLRERLVPRYMKDYPDGRLRLTEDGMEAVLDSKYGRR